jgi:CubicO group peptidase (beta-lactamase class C family)
MSLSCNTSQDSKTETQDRNVFIDSVEDVLNKRIPKLQLEQKVPAVGVGLIEDGEIKLVKVYGEHQLEKTAPRNTIFNVASIAKVITTITTLKLTEVGDWSLDESLSTYWTDPDIENDSLSKKLTSIHSLTHTTGFKNWRRMNTSGNLEFDFEPGAKFQYSGEGMEYLKTAIESKYKVDLGKLSDSLIFEPLGMEDATLKWVPAKDTLRFAKWYNGNGIEHQVETYSTPDADAADDFLTTVEDLLKLGIAVMDKTIISDELFDEMVKPRVKIHQNASQGLGWTIIEDLPNNNYAINHDGGDMGVAATIILLPNSKSGIVVFTNGDNGRILCNAIVKEAFLFGKEIIQKLYWGGEIPQIVEVNPELLQKYSGTYVTNQNTELSFLVRDNALKIEGEGVPGVEIYPKSNNEFFPTDFEVFFNFEETETEIAFDLLSQGKSILSGTMQK